MANSGITVRENQNQPKIDIRIYGNVILLPCYKCAKKKYQDLSKVMFKGKEKKSIIFKASSQILDCLCHIMNFMYRVPAEHWGDVSNLIFDSQEQNQRVRV